MNEIWATLERLVKSRHGRSVKVQRYGYLEKLWNALHDDELDLIILKAPTGIGKTEAILAPFISQYFTNEYSWLSLIHVLPTRSLVNSMFLRFSNYILSLNLWGKVNVSLDYGDPTIIKPHLEGDIVVTTYDTLVYSMYGFRSWGRHYRLILGKLAQSVIVLDEVQLLQDRKWFSPRALLRHVDFLLKLGSKVILMSATIPDITIENLLKNHKRTKIIEAEDIANNRGVIKEVNIINEPILEVARDYIKNNVETNKILIVCNSVAKAIDLFQHLRTAFKELIGITLLHSRLRRKIRRSREELLEKSNEGRIVIATQVIEAGLDYNFDLLITEIAPIDAIIQRLGRIARRVKTEGKAIIIANKDSMEIASKVYGEPIVKRAYEIVKYHISELNESVRNVKVANPLINEQYDKVIIEKITKENRPIEDILSLIDSLKGNLVRNVYIDQSFLESQYYRKQANLLRLGIEIRAIYPTEEIKQKMSTIIKGQSDKVDFNYELLDEIVSLSVENRKIPRSLIFTENSEKYIIEAEIEKDLTGKTYLSLRRHDINKIKGLSNRSFYILNPEYYEFYNEYDLGLRRI